MNLVIKSFPFFNFFVDIIYKTFLSRVLLSKSFLFVVVTSRSKLLIDSVKVLLFSVMLLFDSCILFDTVLKASSIFSCKFATKLKCFVFSWSKLISYLFSIQIVENNLVFDIYYNLTNSFNYLTYTSCHPRNTKNKVSLSLAKRIVSIVSNNKENRLKELKEHLLDRKHPQHIIGYSFTEIYQPKFRNENNDNITFIRTYNANYNINLKKFHSYIYQTAFIIKMVILRNVYLFLLNLNLNCWLGTINNLLVVTIKMFFYTYL